MAAADMFEIRLNGVGAHGAMPHQGVDPIICGAALVQSLQSIVSRRVSPLSPAVVSVTIFEAGSAMNVIPGTARLAGTARSFSADVRAMLEASIREIAETTARTHGCGLELDWITGYPPTVNHLAEADRAATVAASVLGVDKIVTDIEPSMAS